MSEQAKAEVVEVDGHKLVKVSLPHAGFSYYGTKAPSHDMTPLEAEKFADQIRSAAHKARRANVKPRKFGDH